MTKELFIGIMTLVFVGLLSISYHRETHFDIKKNIGQKYKPLISGTLLPQVLLIAVLLWLKFYGAAFTARKCINMLYHIFLLITLYYAVLLLILPSLRKCISARTCALLWLIPNWLYITQYDTFPTFKPRIIFHVSGKLVAAVFVLWLIGFLTCFLGNIFRHLTFRKELLKNAVPVTDPEILELFQEEAAKMALQSPSYQLVTTKDVSSPLTIGLYQRSTKLILPMKSYSSKELSLIFRHELVHICRWDSWTKFFMMFCTAMCWFNPLMWTAMKKSAEDLELSCDESVLLDSDESTRKQYAALLLNTAGDDRGFSSCLSASAASMRYRLKSVMNPRKCRSGMLLVALTFFLLCMTCGFTALAYGDATAATTVFRGQDPAKFHAYDISLFDETGNVINKTSCIDPKALTEFIAGLSTQEITWNYSYSDTEKYLAIWYDSPQGDVLVELETNYLRVKYFEDRAVWQVYYLPEPTNWEAMESELL